MVEIAILCLSIGIVESLQNLFSMYSENITLVALIQVQNISPI